MNKASVIAVMVAATFLAAAASTSRVARAQVILPPPPTITNTYAAKFICGVQRDNGISDVPDAQPGRYSSKINVHNNTGMVIRYRKKIISLSGGQVATDPQAKVKEELKSDQAMEVVCRDIYKHLNIAVNPPSVPPYVEGFVIIEVYQAFHTPAPPPDPLDVEGIYTYKGELPATLTTQATGTGVSIAVVVYPAKSNRHPLQ